MSIFWSLWIILLTVICLALVIWVLFANRKVAVRDDEEPENRTTGHIYDGIEEYDNPLPKWWFQLFVITIIFAVIYLILYPGLGSFKGILGWTSVESLERDQGKAEAGYAPLFDKYMSMSIDELAHDGAAMKMGIRLFSNNCAVCHGADGSGHFGFPNLTDKDWLYGGAPEQIKYSIAQGRQGSMPAWGPILGEDKVMELTHYVLSLSGAEHDHQLAANAQPTYIQSCSACHGSEGKGNISLGGPNLTDDIWLYSGAVEEIAQSIRKGRGNLMPSQHDKLKEHKIHLLTAYVYGMSLDH